MPKKININTYIGQKFGHLTITKIWRDTQVREIKCLALCDYCQQEKEYRFRSLTTGATKSCGCLHKIDLNNLPGQKFNRLLILEAKKEKRNNDSHNYIYVKCKCDCGNIVECRFASLKNNTIQSCGCLHKEISSINLNDLIGKQYDKLIIIDAYRNDENKIRIKAKCECGNIIDIAYRNLQKNTNMCKQCRSKEIKSNNLQNLKELINKQYGKLIIIDAYRNDKSEIRIKAKCECGNIIDTRYRNLIIEKTKSCGKCKQINLNDLIGKKYNKLTIIDAYENNYNKIWVKVQCECGNIIDISYSNLQKNINVCKLCKLKSNNLLNIQKQKNNKINLNDLIGKQYDKLIIIDAYRNNENKIRIKAKCECGNIIDIPYRSLQKNTNMCKQCKFKKIKSNNLQNLKELINKQYGKLIIIDAYRNDKSEIRIKAKCECGNIIDTRYRNLIIEKTKSCGKCKQINLNDLIGKKYNKLTIIDAKREKGRIYVNAKCDCGNIKKYYYSCLKNGHTQSCGCINRTTNGESITRLYKIYKHIKNRCYNIKDPRYSDWGGRGIIVCDEWKDNFRNFKQWALNNGYNDTLTIDRIDNNDNYEPNNCRWITQKIQNRNKRNTKYITINNETKTLADWCEIYNIKYKIVLSRIYRKWDPLKALITPIKK